MGVMLSIQCPRCLRPFGLRYDPGPDDQAPSLAREELLGECPDHDGKAWSFWPLIHHG